MAYARGEGVQRLSEPRERRFADPFRVGSDATGIPMARIAIPSPLDSTCPGVDDKGFRLAEPLEARLDGVQVFVSVGSGVGGVKVKVL